MSLSDMLMLAVVMLPLTVSLLFTAMLLVPVLYPAVALVANGARFILTRVMQ